MIKIKERNERLGKSQSFIIECVNNSCFRIANKDSYYN